MSSSKQKKNFKCHSTEYYFSTSTTENANVVVAVEMLIWYKEKTDWETYLENMLTTLQDDDLTSSLNCYSDWVMGKYQ